MISAIYIPKKQCAAIFEQIDSKLKKSLLMRCRKASRLSQGGIRDEWFGNQLLQKG